MPERVVGANNHSPVPTDEPAPWRTWLKSKPGILAMLDDAKSVAIKNQSLQVIFPTGSLWLDTFKERANPK